MKALIKETGEVKEVKSMWHTQTVSFDFTFDTDDVDTDTEKYTNYFIMRVQRTIISMMLNFLMEKHIKRVSLL